MTPQHVVSTDPGGLLARLRRQVTSARLRRDADERGSALLISLMVMVILTMMGVTFLVLSEQENKISINSRDHAQTIYLAEAAINVGLTWFNDPSTSNNFLPATNQMNRTLRKGRVFAQDWDNDDELAAGITDTSGSVDGSAGNIYTGGTAGDTGSQPFEKKYRGDYAHGLWGRRDTPDVLICGSSTLDVDGDGTPDCTSDMAAYLTDLNNTLLMSTPLRDDGHSSRDYGVLEVEQIRVYRPPIDFTLHTRYGIATIEATTVKRVQNQVVARRTVREVIQEIPFPGPGGAIETEGVIGFAGSSEVHWGAVVSASTGDDIDLGNTTANFVDAAVARDTSGRFGFHYTINPAAFANFQGPNDAENETWLTEALGITRNGTGYTANFEPPAIGDPWLLFRARRQVRVDGAAIGSTVQPRAYPGTNAQFLSHVTGNNASSRRFDKLIASNHSHMFQKQIVRFPPIDYDTWKAIAQSGQQGMYYFKWDSGTSYRQDGIGTLRTWTSWIDLYDKGVFFFDTKDSKKPLADGSNLTPAHGWTPGMYVEGFFYVNSVAFDSTGAGNASTRPLNSPGEPFLDDGIDLHGPGETAGDNCICLRFDEEDGCVLGARPIRITTGPGLRDGDDFVCATGTGAGQLAATTMTAAVARREASTFRNGVWDSDLDNDGHSDASGSLASNSGWTRFKSANTDGALDGGHGYAAGMLPGYPPGGRFQQGTFNGTDTWRRDPRFLNNIDFFGATVANRQPHEPFLNFDSSTNGNTVANWSDSPQDDGRRVNYQAEDEVTKRNTDGTVASATTRARDNSGPLVGLQPHVNGVMFFEGEYTGAGNIEVYGSMLMKGGYTSTGSLEVWFNEDLVKGKFPPPEWRLPRVFSTARDAE